jgi:hypothetical protein
MLFIKIIAARMCFSSDAGPRINTRELLLDLSPPPSNRTAKYRCDLPKQLSPATSTSEDFNVE